MHAEVNAHQLRALWESIEGTRLHSGGYQEVTGALWSGPAQQRSLHFQEIPVVQKLTDCAQHPMPQLQVLRHPRPPVLSFRHAQRFHYVFNSYYVSNSLLINDKCMSRCV